MDSLVSTQWLASELGASDLRIVDASAFLPEYGRNPLLEYEACHIPGAVFMNLAELTDPALPGMNMLPSAERFASRMQSLGLGDGSRIVVYDDSPIRSAPRAWCMLTMFGAASVALRSKGDVLANLDTGRELVVDARGPGRFTGDVPEVKPGLASGHIPGARNVYYASLFRPDGTWKSPADIRSVFEAAEVDLSRPIISSCGSGMTANVLIFALHLIGKDDTALYDGSWTEWGADEALPKETGAAR